MQFPDLHTCIICIFALFFNKDTYIKVKKVMKVSFLCKDTKDTFFLVISRYNIFFYFLFITRYFPNPKFQASIHILWLYSPVCVGPCRRPRTKTGFLMTRLTLFSRASTKTKVISTITDVQMYESPSFDLLTTGLMKRGDKVCTFSDNRHNIII